MVAQGFPWYIECAILNAFDYGCVNVEAYILCVSHMNVLNVTTFIDDLLFRPYDTRHLSHTNQTQISGGSNSLNASLMQLKCYPVHSYFDESLEFMMISSGLLL